MKGGTAASAAKSAITRRPDGAAWQALRDIPGMTYRKFDYWTRLGLIHCEIERDKVEMGSGVWRTITEHEVHVVTLMSELVNLGLLPHVAGPLARALASGDITTFGGFQIRRAS